MVEFVPTACKSWPLLVSLVIVNVISTIDGVSSIKHEEKRGNTFSRKSWFDFLWHQIQITEFKKFSIIVFLSLRKFKGAEYKQKKNL